MNFDAISLLLGMLAMAGVILALLLWTLHSQSKPTPTRPDRPPEDKP